MTGPDYGRIFHHELVEAVQRICVRIGQIVGVEAAEMVPHEAGDLDS